MSSRKRIVFLDRTTPELRKVVRDHLPPGFELNFAEADSEEEAAAGVVGADYVLVWSTYVPTRVVEAAAGAKLIEKIGEGTDRIDVRTAKRLGMLVCNTSGSNSVSVAEAATMLILAALRWLPRAHNSVVAGHWLKFELRTGSYELKGKQVGIVGLGKIGRLVLRHLQGFEARTVYFDIGRLAEFEEARLGVHFLPLDDLLETSDVVTLHVPLLESTRGMIGRRELALMKRTSILVNTCRGAVVDEEALTEALRERRIRGAGIDAWTKEPLPANHPLLSLDNVVLTPHIAGGTEDSEIKGVQQAYANIVALSEGREIDPIYLV